MLQVGNSRGLTLPDGTGAWRTRFMAKSSVFDRDFDRLMRRGRQVKKNVSTDAHEGQKGLYKFTLKNQTQ